MLTSTDNRDPRSFAQQAPRAADSSAQQAGRLEPGTWDDVTEPAIDRSRFDHEHGAPIEAVEPEGLVS
jgi:hypothetical protein